ncbi:formyltetrahydrofolate deformylase [Pseudomonas sp. Pseusp3]|uniref:formyltetrahydrofolate deformylase n=1 Tax=Pseudomonas sp. Pseusp3 TaxID=3243029 RepID=UPI0039AF04F4
MIMDRTYCLAFDCPDKVGIVARVSGIFADHGGWIAEASHHSDEESRRFFSRILIRADSVPFDYEALKRKILPLAEELQMNWRLVDSHRRKRVVLMCSRGSHCMTDLLDRWKSGDLHCDIACVISNHEDMRGLADWFDIPFHYVPIEKHNKAEGFDRTEALIDEYQADCIVLARYMQILPQNLCERYRHKVINIHHSFLPSFIGAKPYHQASRRGVKLIGATCHYVTEDLDEGPIIDQDVVRVSHQQNVDDLVRLGKDVEKTVLARGLRSHLEDRVLVYGNKTVVF